MVFVGSLFSLFGNIIAKNVLTFAGELNIIYLGIILECSRLVIWAFVKYVSIKSVRMYLFSFSLQIKPTILFGSPLCIRHQYKFHTIGGEDILRLQNCSSGFNRYNCCHVRGISVDCRKGSWELGWWSVDRNFGNNTSVFLHCDFWGNHVFLHNVNQSCLGEKMGEKSLGGKRNCDAANE